MSGLISKAKQSSAKAERVAETPSESELVASIDESNTGANHGTIFGNRNCNQPEYFENRNEKGQD